MRVECYSGHKGEQRPVRFELDGRQYFVEEILDQWFGPDDQFFRLRADDGNIYILRHRAGEQAGDWSLESFRKQ